MGKEYNNTIIADTSGLISLVVDTDRNYSIAQQAADQLASLYDMINSRFEFTKKIGTELLD